MQFLSLLSFISCSLGSKEVTQSGHLHLQVVTNIHLLCLKMQDADQLSQVDWHNGIAAWKRQQTFLSQVDSEKPKILT